MSDTTTFDGDQEELPWGMLQKLNVSIPGYQLQSVIAHGGQAIVLKAIEVESGKTVAIKLLREGPLATSSARERLRREFAVLQAIKHPCIVAVLKQGTADDRDYLVMDYIAGRTLDKFLFEPSDAATSDPATVLRLFVRICDGVNAAHRNGIVHRDLSPSNVLVDDRGEPHVLDFGLARTAFDRFLGDNHGPASVTGQFLGKLRYASPEQAQGSSKIDIRSDVYSLGVMIYEAITGGEFPYKVVGHMTDVLSNIVHTPPTPPSSWKRIESSPNSDPTELRLRRRDPPIVNAAIEAIILKALEKKPDDRYQSAGELGKDLENYLAGRPTLAQISPVSEPPTRAASRYAAAGAVLVSSAIGVGAALYLAFFRFAANEPSTRLDAAPANAKELLSPAAGSLTHVAPQNAALPPNVVGAWAIDGEELIALPFPTERRLEFGADGWSNYDFSFQAKAAPTRPDEKAAPFHAGFHWESVDQHYKFSMGAYGNKAIQFHYYRQGTWGRNREAYRLGTIEFDRWYNVRIEVRGSEFRAFVDGHEITRDKNVAFTQGRVALLTPVSSEVRFRSIKVIAQDGNVLWDGLPALDSNRVADGASAGRGRESDPTGTAVEPDKPTSSPLAPQNSELLAAVAVGHWQIEGNDLVVQPSTAHQRLEFGDPKWASYDFSFEAQAAEPAGGRGRSPFGAGFHWSSADNHYAFALGTFAPHWKEPFHQFRFRKDGNDNRNEGVARLGKVAYDQWHQVRVEIRGADFRGFLNGVEIAKDHHDEFRQGRVALLVQRDNRVVRFRNLRVVSPDGTVLWDGLPALDNATK